MRKGTARRTAFTDINKVMLTKPLTQKLKLLRATSTEEDAVSLVEILIAGFIIVLIALSTIAVLTNSFRSQTNLENRSKATQIAQETIAIAKQSSYRRLYTPTQSQPTDYFSASTISPKCRPDARISSSGELAYLGGKIAWQPLDYASLSPESEQKEFPGISYCSKKTFGQKESREVGANFYVQTDVIRLGFSSLDGFSKADAGADANDEIRAKRVIVTVRWQDVKTGPDTFDEVVMHYTVTPSPMECKISSVFDSEVVPVRQNAIGNGEFGCY